MNEQSPKPNNDFLQRNIEKTPPLKKEDELTHRVFDSQDIQFQTEENRKTSALIHGYEDALDKNTQKTEGDPRVEDYHKYMEELLKDGSNLTKSIKEGALHHAYGPTVEELLRKSVQAHNLKKLDAVKHAHTLFHLEKRIEELKNELEKNGDEVIKVIPEQIELYLKTYDELKTLDPKHPREN